MHLRRSLLASLALLLLAAPAAHAETTLGETSRATPVTAYGDLTAWSAYDEASGGYALVVRVGAETRELPVARSATPFDADAGPNAQGRPELVYPRCDIPAIHGHAPQGCDLYRFDLVTNAETPISELNTAAGSEYAPTTWRGTVAYARSTRTTTEILVAGRGTRGLLPKRKCFTDYRTNRRTCRKTTERRVDDLELAGSRLAAVTYVNYRGAIGFGDAEVRLATVGHVGARTVAETSIGLSGVEFTGPAFDRGRLSFYRGCAGDTSGCGRGRAGVYRYGLARRTYDEAAGPVNVQGHAAAGGVERIVRCARAEAEVPDRDCRIVALDGAAFHRVEAPR